MGIFLNPGGDKFQKSKRSQIYVDHSGMLTYLNSVFDTERRFICVSRPRRFGKSMAANMIAAYYDRTVDSSLFHGMKIADSPTWTNYVAKYDVIQVNMQDLLDKTQNLEAMLQLLTKSILWDLLEEYPNYRYFDETDLERTMSDIYAKTKRPFVIIIDEWDAIFRKYSRRTDWHSKYLDFLRIWLKDKAYVGLAYMTGILPIKKYGTHSALNMFSEFSMENPRELAEYVGFTTAEVKSLCAEYGRDFEECRIWYDGYFFAGVGEVYNPHAIVEAVTSGIFDTYWNKTETFEALKIYLDLDMDGLRDIVISLMAGERRRINTNNFTNDMTTFNSADDVLTLLIHLGYLGYDFLNSSVFIPNQEIYREYANAITDKSWSEVAKAIKSSDNLLRATLTMDARAVAEGIEAAHLETSHLQYNDENALAYTISLAYYAARRKYIIVREFPTGKGFADMIFLPRPNFARLPALIIELKWNQTVAGAVKQIKAKQYATALDGYAGDILLVGINYDQKSRKHECIIESVRKES